MNLGTEHDRPIAVTFFQSFAADRKTEGGYTMPALASLIAETTGPSKDKLPWLKLARFGDVRTTKKSLRHDANVLAITGIEVDYDAEAIPVDVAVEKLVKAGVQSIIYTSPSHTEDTPRWRVLCPKSKELPPAERKHLIGRINGLFGGVFANESWTLSQSYYLGSVNKNPSHRVEVIDGDAIDLMDELDEIWIGPPDTKPAANGAGSIGPLDEPALLKAIAEGRSYHQAAVRLLGRWAFQGVPFMEARKRLVDAMESVFPPDRDARWEARRADVDRCLEDIYGKEAKAKDEGRRSEKPSQGQPSTGQAASLDQHRPKIEVVRGAVDVLATAGEAALRKSSLPVFQRGAALVIPISHEVPAARGKMTVAAGFKELSTAAMIDHLAQAAEWRIWNARKKETVPCDPPPMVASIILSRSGSWTLPPVAGVITTPTLRPDGSILSAAGYDPTTRLYHVADPSLVLPAIADKPSKAEAAAALALLDGLLNEFPFVSKLDRAVALSGLVTPVVRGALPVVPMHVIGASTAGTGKSYLADVASVISTARVCPVVAAGQNDEETEKRLVGLLLAGFSVISLDNVNGELGGDLLCQMIERPLVRVRPLGRSEIVELESRATMFATGNGIRVRGDMTRRTLMCNLDAGVERPELRPFKGDPVQAVLKDRGGYVAAALTIVRAYLAAGQPNKAQSLASLSGWSDTVRSSLIWLGQPDPAASMEAARADDPELIELREILQLWQQHLGTDALTAREIAERSSERLPTNMGEPTDLAMPEFRDALMRIAGERGAVNTRRLGKWLLTKAGRIVDGRRIKKSGTADGGLIRWTVETMR